MAYTTINKSSIILILNFIQVMLVLQAITGVGFQPDWFGLRTGHKLLTIIYLMQLEVQKNITSQTQLTAEGR